MSQEWFTRHLAALNELCWGPLPDDFAGALAEAMRVFPAIRDVTGMSEADAFELVKDRLMNSEAERQIFFRRYGILRAPEIDAAHGCRV